MKERLFLAALMITTALILPAVVAGPAQAGREDDTFVVALYTPLAGVDTFNLTTPVRVFTQNVDGFLTRVTPDGGTEPAIAESVDFPDPTTMDVVLREGVKFHDGSVLNADDVVFTFEAAMSPAAKAAGLSKNDRANVLFKRIEKTGPMSVRFHLNDGVPHSLLLFDLAGGIPLRQKDSFEPGVVQPTFNGLGPYKIVSSNDQEINLERHDEYYDKNRVPAIRYLKLRNVPDWGTQQAEILSGGVNMIFQVPDDIAANLANHPEIDRVQADTFSYQQLPMDAQETFEGQPNPLSNVDVRRGITHAINRQQIIDNLRPGRRLIHTPCHPDQMGCSTEAAVRYDYDPDRARELFTQAGYPDGFDFTMWVYRDPDIAEAIAADLAAVGARAELRSAPEPTVEEMRSQRKVQSYLGLYGNSGNADASRSIFKSHSPNEREAISLDDEVTALLDKLYSTADTEDRRNLFDALVHRITDQALEVPISTVTQNWLLRDVDLGTPADKAFPLFYEATWK